MLEYDNNIKHINVEINKFLNIFLFKLILFLRIKTKLIIPTNIVKVPINLFIGKIKLISKAKKLKKIIPYIGFSDMFSLFNFSLKSKFVNKFPKEKIIQFIMKMLKKNITMN